MANNDFDRARLNSLAADPADKLAPSEGSMAAHSPPEEAAQPDPALRLSVGRFGAGPVALVAILCAIILGVVLYGLNGPSPSVQTASAPPAASSVPAAGGKSGPAIPSAPQTNNSGHS